MNNSERARLMHTVLDGEATEAEARELERMLAAEPAARNEFEHLRQLFDGLSRVPKAFPPEGLVAAVMANIPQNSQPQGRLDQLSLRSRVIGLAWKKARGTSPGKSATDLPAHQPGIYLREWKMSEQSGSLSRKRNALIGGGIAIVAALFALSYTIDFPSGVQNTVGTIVPAQRFHAAQPTADEIKVGGQAATQSLPLQAGSATNAAASNAVNAGTGNNSVTAGTVNSTINAATGNNGITAGINAATGNNGINAGTANNMINAATTSNAVSAGTVNANVNATTNNAVSAASNQSGAMNATSSNAMNSAALNNAVSAGSVNAQVNANTNNAVSAAAANKASMNASTNNAVQNATVNAVGNNAMTK